MISDYLFHVEFLGFGLRRFQWRLAEGDWSEEYLAKVFWQYIEDLVFAMAYEALLGELNRATALA